jgi:YD repeat-containing protein
MTERKSDGNIGQCAAYDRSIQNSFQSAGQYFIGFSSLYLHLHLPRIRVAKILTALAFSLAVFSFVALGTPSSAWAGSDGGSPPVMMLPGQFNVSATGAATYTVPIAVPPGTAGMVPALSLDYSSQNGDGTLGLGWTLSGLPSIGRCPRTVAQDAIHGGVNYDANDRICMEGQRLMVISGTYGADNSEYRTEIEGFSKIVAHGTAGNGPAWFEVRTKSGQIMQFGNTADAQLLAVGKTTARAWAANRITDTKGNYLTVTYTDDAVNGQAYPTRIDYTGNTGLTPYNSVQFTYNTARPDVTPTYQAGSLQQTTLLLTNVKTFTGATLVSDYRITYELGTSLRHSRITSIQLCDGAGVCLAPTTFGWQGSRDTLTMTAVPNALGQGIEILTKKPSRHGFFPNDFNADALSDVALGRLTSQFCSSASSIYAGSQAGTFSQLSMGPQFTHADSLYDNSGGCFVSNVPGGATYTQFGDFNADGHTDVLMSSFNNPGTNHHFMFAAGNTFNELYFTNLSSTKDITLGDFNGDGRTDFLTPTNPGLAYFSNGDGTFTPDAGHGDLSSEVVLAADFDGNGCADLFTQGSTNNILYLCNPAVAQIAITHWIGNGWQVVLGDYDGDGKVDALMVKSGTAGSLNLSTGTSLAQSSFAVPGSWGNYLVYAGDWNGDQKTDIVLIAPGGGTNLVFLSTGTGFVQVATIAGGGSSVKASIGDWNNDGADDIWIQKSTGDTEYLFSYVPELLTTVSNGLGIITTFTYDRLNHATIYTKDTTGTYPTVNLNGPMYVVSQVDSSDAIGGVYSSTYSYTGAKADLTGRGFLGFKQRIVTDLETGTVQTTNYDQAFPYLGLIDSETKVAHVPNIVGQGSTASTISTITNTFGSTNLGGTRRFVFLQQKVEASNDLSRQGFTAQAFPTVTTSYVYDTFGNPTTVTVSTTGSSKVTTNTYSNDTTNWFLGRLLTASTNSTVNSISLTRSSSFAYDAATGLLTQEVVEPNFPTLKLTTIYTYDSFGNKKTATVSGSGIVTRATTTNYDVKGEFATSIVNALNQSESWAYHASFGAPTSHTGPNNLTTTWGYDSFGRKTLETRPDGNKTGVAYFYCAGVFGGTSSCPALGAYAVRVTPLASNGATQNGPISWAYFDALSRVIAKDVQGFDGSWIRVATQYDSFGRVAQNSRPYFITGGTPRWTINQYDVLGRVIEMDLPGGTFHSGIYVGPKYTYGFNALTTTVSTLAGTRMAPIGETTTTVKNAQGLVASVTDPAGNVSTYTYDPFGNLKTTTDSAGNVITNTYDLRGRKTASSDPDMGNWTYSYDVLDELVSQTDAKNQTTTLTYDKLGRLTQRAEPGLTSTWVYDTAANGIGKLRSASGSNGYSRVHSYDALGRPSSAQIIVAGQTYTMGETYDSTGHLLTATYPSGFAVKYTYTSLGYLSSLKDNVTSQVYWTVSTRDAELHTLTQIAGNGITTTQTFDVNTGRIDTIQVGANNTAADFEYTFDDIGNLLQREDHNQSQTEGFCYDNLNRLTNAVINPQSGTKQQPLDPCTTGDIVKTVAYDPLGNITSKSDVGTYVYPLAGQPLAHAVQSINGTVNGVVNPVFTYDANGNMTDGAGRTITYTSWNMAATITQGSTNIAYDYDCEHQRISQAAPEGTTIYLSDPGSGISVEKFTGASAGQWNEYLFADGRMVGEHFGRAYVLTPTGAFAVKNSEHGYEVRQIGGNPLSDIQIRSLNRQIEQWNRPGGGQCHVVSC